MAVLQSNPSKTENVIPDYVFESLNGKKLPYQRKNLIVKFLHSTRIRSHLKQI